MVISKEQALVAPCGIHCGLCEMYLAKEKKEIRAYLIGKGIPEHLIPCSGCRENQGHCPIHPGECATYECVKNKGHQFCNECADYPCTRLQPAADRAGTLPHNLKVYNLAVISHQGLDRFLEKAAKSKELYFKGKMEIGNGPQE